MTIDKHTREGEQEFEDPSTAWVSDALLDLGHVEPPETLVSTVMSHVQNAERLGHQQSTGGATKTGRKALWGVMAAAAVLIIGFLIEGFPPGENGSIGTIGAAKRYQAEQIANTDVKTDDAALQAFLQSDTFQTLSSDKSAREALTNKAFQTAVADPAVRAALASPSVVRALAAPAVAQALASPGFRSALGSSALQKALANPAFQAALASSAFQNALASSAFQAALASSGFQNALASQAFFLKAEAAMR